MKPMTENDFKKYILDCFSVNKILAWRNNTGAFAGSYKGKQRFFRYGVKGSGDIFALHKGQFYSIEVKRKGNKPSHDQYEWLGKINENGGYAFWIDDIGDFNEWFDMNFKSG